LWEQSFTTHILFLTATIVFTLEERCSDVNKATSHKAKARELKAKDFQHSPRPCQGQGHSRHTATVLDQNKTSDVIYLPQSIAVNDKNKIPFITSVNIFDLLLE